MPSSLFKEAVSLGLLDYADRTGVPILGDKGETLIAVTPEDPKGRPNAWFKPLSKFLYLGEGVYKEDPHFYKRLGSGNIRNFGAPGMSNKLQTAVITKERVRLMASLAFSKQPETDHRIKIRNCPADALTIREAEPEMMDDPEAYNTMTAYSFTSLLWAPADLQDPDPDPEAGRTIPYRFPDTVGMRVLGRYFTHTASPDTRNKAALKAISRDLWPQSEAEIDIPARLDDVFANAVDVKAGKKGLDVDMAHKYHMAQRFAFVGKFGITDISYVHGSKLMRASNQKDYEAGLVPVTESIFEAARLDQRERLVVRPEEARIRRPAFREAILC